MLPYLVLAGLGLVAWKSASQKTPVAMTPRQEMIFEQALAADNPPLTPAQLTTLAESYEADGFVAQAYILRKRARIGQLTPDQLAAAKAALQHGLNGRDTTAIRVLANAFEADCFFGNAFELRKWANSLDMAAEIAAVQASKQSQAARQESVAAAVAGTSPTPQSAAAVIASATPDQIAKAKAAVAAEMNQAVNTVVSGLTSSATNPAGSSDAAPQVPPPAQGTSASSAVTGAAKQVLGSIFPQ